eukprot:263956-Amorphochlora_amoeboformis.AAC.1
MGVRMGGDDGRDLLNRVRCAECVDLVDRAWHGLERCSSACFRVYWISSCSVSWSRCSTMCSGKSLRIWARMR